MLVAFLSSTVVDFGPVRDEIAARLTQRRIEVRRSEEADFPVKPGVTSHDACLAAVRSAHVFILLVGERFGGEYRRSNKSVTWREWEEAHGAGLIPIVLIQRDANEVARAIWKRRSELAKKQAKSKKPSAHPTGDLDALLRAEFPDRKPRVHNLPGVQRFIDAVRKGHEDNWIHDEWTGTADDAMRIIDARLGSALASYHEEQAGTRALAARGVVVTKALEDVTSTAGIIAAEVRRGTLDRDAAAQQLLEYVAEKKGNLLGFTEDDVHNLMLYRRNAEVLEPGPRVAHAKIKRRNRSWRVGEGHVGLAVSENAPLVSGDMRQTIGFRSSEGSEVTDAQNYVSSISIPLYLAGNTAHPDGVLIVTSSRVDHFTELDQFETLTAAMLGRIFTMLWT